MSIFLFFTIKTRNFAQLKTFEMQPNGFIEYVRRLPFVRLIIPFLGGIIAEEMIFKQAVNIPFFVILFLSLIFFFLLFFLRFCKSYKYCWLWGVFIYCNLFLVGAGIMKNQQRQSTLLLDEQTFFKSVVIDKPNINERSTRLTLQITAYRDSSKNWIATDEQTFVYLANDSSAVIPQLGDVLLIDAKFTANPSPKNPEEFDYANYLARRDFFATAFISTKDYKKIGCENLWFRKTVSDIQASMFNIFAKVGIQGDNLAVLRALTLGDKQMLSEEIVSAYKTAGAMHVLAVSGLHVGLVYSVLLFLLSPIGKRRTGKFIKAFIIIAALWLYASLAAFSPSVCRACVMVSFLLVGNLINRKINIYNSLSASALFLCVINPFNIFEVGFLLSYCAVFAIVFFQPVLYKLITIKNKLLNYVFALATVSIAAQIGTSGISIFYFHMFPNYFIITNILIIPLVTLIMFLVAATLMVSWIPVIGTVCGKILDSLLLCANEITKHVEMLPYSLTDNIYISPLQNLIIVLIIIFFAFYITFKNKKNLIAILACIVMFFGINSHRKIEHRKHPQMIVYNTRGSSFISFVSNQNSINIRDPHNINNNFDFNTKNNFAKLGIKRTENITFFNDFNNSEIIKSHENIIWFNKKSIKIAVDNEYFESTKPINIDFLIANKYSGNNISAIFTNFLPKTLIIDSSISTWQARQWIAEAKARNVDYHYVAEHGAFVWNGKGNN